MISLCVHQIKLIINVLFRSSFLPALFSSLAYKLSRGTLTIHTHFGQLLSRKPRKPQVLRGCRETGILMHSCWECKNDAAMWEMVIPQNVKYRITTMVVQLLSHVGPLQPHVLEPARLLCPWNFFRQEYRNRLPFPSPVDITDPGTESASPALQADSLLLSHRITTRISNFTFIHKRSESRALNRYRYTHIHTSINYNSQKAVVVQSLSRV